MRIDPDRLTKLRKAKRWSRARLAKRAKISARQIARLENNGTAESRARDRTVEELAKALGVEPGVLSGDLPLPKGAGARVHAAGGSPRQINAPVEPGIGLAYALVKKRYGVGPTTLVNAAPLLFVLLAESSFIWRRKKLEEFKEAMERLDRSCTDSLLYGSGGTYRAGEVAGVERKSIENRDLFGEYVHEYLHCQGYPVPETNSFAEYLGRLSAEIDDPDIVNVAPDALGQVPLENFPDFTICDGDVDAFIGESERRKTALRYGLIRVDNIPENLLSDDAAQERYEWLDRKIENMPEVVKEFLEEALSKYLKFRLIISDLVKDGENS